MAGYNKIMLIGHLGDNPIKTIFQEEKTCVKFSLATSKLFKNSSGDLVEKTQWHRCISFGKTAEIVEKFLKKGDLCAVDGELRYRTWEDKDGINRHNADIYVSNIIHTCK